MTNVYTWSPYLNVPITEIVLGWGYQEWLRELGRLYKSVDWIRILFENELQVLINQGNEGTRSPGYSREDTPNSFKFSDGASGEPKYFTFHSEEMSLIFD
ncbi:MAG: hypothetical protein HKL80_10755 [Acidimicrobiales bacterium]|nr:hypothetical protein [Acidimicrobiales bacterium]